MLLATSPRLTLLQWHSSSSKAYGVQTGTTKLPWVCDRFVNDLFCGAITLHVYSTPVRGSYKVKLEKFSATGDTSWIRVDGGRLISCWYDLYRFMQDAKGLHRKTIWVVIQKHY